MTQIPFFRISKDATSFMDKSYLASMREEDMNMHKNFNKLLRRYQLSMNRLVGRGNQYFERDLMKRFYDTLNSLIQYYNTFDTKSFVRYINNDLCTLCYSMSLKMEYFNDMTPYHADVYIHIPSANGGKELFSYEFSIQNEKDLLNVIWMSMIIASVLFEIDRYLSLYLEDRDKYHPIIKKYIYSLLLIDKDWEKHCVYRSHKNILKYIYCVRGWEYFKHRLFGTLPTEFRFERRK